MNSTTDGNELRKQARDALGRLTGLAGPDDLARSKALVEALRNAREYGAMGDLAEAVSRWDPTDPKNRRLYAQSLIDTGRATAAIDVLEAVTRRLPSTHPEHAEATGLLGRVYKQIFVDAGDKTSPGAREALRQAVAAYRTPWEAAPERNTWHGVNLVALLARARRLGLDVAPDLDPRTIAATIVRTLEAPPSGTPDPWRLPTLAEASLALGDWDAVERHIRAYAADADADAFLIAGTRRQFTEIWDLETIDERGRGLVSILRARLLELSGSGLELKPAEVKHLHDLPDPEIGQLEAVLGKNGPQTFRWWKTGLGRALAVAAIRRKLGSRFATGFLVRASDLGREPGDELLVLTNFHVINAQGVSPGVRPERAEVVFEAVDPDKAYAIKEILWSSPVGQHDVALLRLAEPVTGVAPLPIAGVLPDLGETARVYVIGHPGGRDLAFSFQDNELLDHEGPPAGQPAIPGVCRVHYGAPTEGGSSGSPVFDATAWEVVALHHKGGRTGMPKLNGVAGTYAANEGISLQSIKAAMAPK
ncbi:TRAFs-binding domain-containing protein [Methylobacterium sp. EM32]|uniref:TRAFs-binding domain-containing protein n=1 Tax=Methylobacterium sp. EM32 TaxID=3163481 RepID=UPI0033B642A6